MERDLTKGSVFKNLIYFSIPFLFSYFLQALYGLADLFIIGRFNGVESTTAVSIGSQVMHMITVMIVGLGMGTTVSIGHSVGEAKKDEIKKEIGTSFTLFMSLSIALTFFLILLIKPIVGIMNTPLEAREEAISYLSICFLGIPFIALYNLISSIYRGLGDSKTPLIFISISCFLNIVLDYLFIGFFSLGAMGAALGTTISQSMSALIALYLVRKKKEVQIDKRDLLIDKKCARSILKIGGPILLQDGLIQVAFIFITVIVNGRGLTDAASVGIVEKIISFLFLVHSSLLSSVSAISSQNIGAGEIKRAKRTLFYALCIAICFGLLMTLCAQIWAGKIVGIFTEDALVITSGAKYLKGYIFDTIFAGIHFCFSGYFCALGKSFLSFLHNIIAIVFVRIPGVYMTSLLYVTTLYPVGIATSMGSFVSVIICIISYIVLIKKEKESSFSIQ